MIEIAFVLVEPAREENVGAAARAMKTMGFAKMVLVNPCDHLSERSRVVAHASNDVLEGAQVFKNLREALNDYSLVVASSAKKRNLNKDILSVNQLPEILKEKKGIVQNVAIVFGREESGLTNEELDLCHLVSTIPMRRKYPSLNLGQAVMVYAQHLSNLFFDYKQPNKRIASSDELKHISEGLSVVLNDLDIAADKPYYGKIQERIMLLGQNDLQLIHQIIKHYKSRHL